MSDQGSKGLTRTDPYHAKAPLKWRILRQWHRLQRKLWPSNATCNNENCGYRTRRTMRGIWCPACWEDGNPGELILDTKGAKK